MTAPVSANSGGLRRPIPQRECPAGANEPLKGGRCAAQMLHRKNVMGVTQAQRLG